VSERQPNRGREREREREREFNLLVVGGMSELVRLGRERAIHRPAERDERSSERDESERLLEMRVIESGYRYCKDQ
jgi:hypothetical protein